MYIITLCILQFAALYHTVCVISDDDTRNADDEVIRTSETAEQVTDDHAALSCTGECLNIQVMYQCNVTVLLLHGRMICLLSLSERTFAALLVSLLVTVI